MNLESLLNVIGSGEIIRIATQNGNSWIIANKQTNSVFNDQYYELLKNREIENVYTGEAREKSQYCCQLLPAICIIVTGDENGIF